MKVAVCEVHPVQLRRLLDRKLLKPRLAAKVSKLCHGQPVVLTIAEVSDVRAAWPGRGKCPLALATLN